jgi:RNA recognition motif-containing protein
MHKPSQAFLGNIPYNARENDIADLFVDMEVEDIYIVREQDTQRSKGYGYISFRKQQDLDMALETAVVTLFVRINTSVTRELSLCVPAYRVAKSV